MSRFISVLALLSSCVVALGDYTPEALADQVTNLPGAEKLDIKFNQFSGYVKVNSTKNLHYWLVESERDPVNDPIAFWTNGGPGCSGLLGFLTEQGPFRTDQKDLSLTINPYAWNKIANMVFIEQPCGVGFSYTDEPEGDDYKTNDAQAAKDNYALIQAFLEKFPQFRSNELYVTSESYGGHYMPTVSKEIVDRNAAGADPKLNFKGFFLGNPATTFYSAIGAGLDTYWGHQLVDKPLYDGFVKNCRGADHFNMTICEAYYMKMYMEIGNLNPYALDYPVCTDESNTAASRARKSGREQRAFLLNHILPSIFTLDTNADGSYKLSNEHKKMLGEIKQAIGLEPVDGYEPCAEDYMTTWLNTPAVQSALHVKAGTVWEPCSRTIKYKSSDGHHDMTPYYNYLIDGKFGLNLVVFSGDDDDVCATIGTQSWIWDLGYKVDGKKWEAYEVDGQVGGYATHFEKGLSFYTVHGAGHEVPAYKPNVAYYLWDQYLQGKLNSKHTV